MRAPYRNALQCFLGKVFSFWRTSCSLEMPLLKPVIFFFYSVLSLNSEKITCSGMFLMAGAGQCLRIHLGKKVLVNS